MIWLYDLLWAAGFGLGAPLWVPWALSSSRRREGLGERLSLLPRLVPGTVWIHAASVGEVEAARPLIAALARQATPLLVTTQTASGRARVRASFPDLAARLAPLDLPGLAHLCLRRGRPWSLVLVETELWPNLIRQAHAVGARVVVASGRISDRSFPRYRRARRLVEPLLRRVARIGARSPEDRQRFIALGAPPERVSVTGDLKLDRPPAPPPGEELRRALGRGPFLIGGSTHAGEEEALLEAWGSLRRGPAPGLRLILAPRHTQRVPGVRAAARRFGVRAGLRSRGAADCEVVVIDTMGELASIYRLCELVFAGGTLVEVGGHNLVEPVQAGKLVVHGPHTGNQRHQVEILGRLGALRRLENASELAPLLGALWADPRRHAPAEEARGQLEQHRGAARRVLALITGEEAPRA